MYIIPLSLYIHFPWCIRKCPYCDFNSHSLTTDLPEDQYINALIQDLEHALPSIQSRSLRSIFMGGGTPSLFSASAIEKLLSVIKSHLYYDTDLEITLEVNPGTVEQQKFADFRTIGINRLSLGIQSFQNEKLKILGRIHNSAEAQKAIEIAHKAGFKNFNIDLMFGLPRQTINDALFDLETAISFNPTHISWYQLTLEPNTYFYHFPPKLPDDQLIWEMQEQGQMLLDKNNFSQYEISAYCKNERKCKHNMNYWEFGDYLGIGAGAHSKITNLSNKSITRFIKHKNPKDYLYSQEKIDEKIITLNDLPLEFMMNVLRLYDDIPLTLFKERTGLNTASIETRLKTAEARGLLRYNHQFISTTPLGKRFLNELLQIFLG